MNNSHLSTTTYYSSRNSISLLQALLFFTMRQTGSKLLSHIPTPKERIAKYDHDWMVRWMITDTKWTKANVHSMVRVHGTSQKMKWTRDHCDAYFDMKYLWRYSRNDISCASSEVSNFISHDSWFQHITTAAILHESPITQIHHQTACLIVQCNCNHIHQLHIHRLSPFTNNDNKNKVFKSEVQPIQQTVKLHCESKKPMTVFVHDYAKCWTIFIILSALDSARNFQ